jgi:mannose-1-phosphate guanylyltransferase
MFIFKIPILQREMRKYMPKHDRVLKNIQFYFDQDIKGEKLAKKTKLLFDDFEKISIDYGIMEKTDTIKVIPVDFGWNDIGSFNAFEDVYACDKDKNTVRNTNFEYVNCSGNIVFSENLEIKAIGLENLVVVQSGNKLLICDKYEIDKIKKIL